MAIESDLVLIENILLAAIIVGSICLERWLVEQSRGRKEREAMKKIINIIINDLENKLRLLESNGIKGRLLESNGIKGVQKLHTFLHGYVGCYNFNREALITLFGNIEDLQHSYSWMKYYNTELNIGKSDEYVLKDLLTNVKKSLNQSLKNLAETKNL